jgi:hypothetical protein
MNEVGKSKIKPFYLLPSLYGLMPSRWRETEINSDRFDIFIAQLNVGILARFGVLAATIWMLASIYLDLIGFRCEDSMLQRSGAVLVAMALLLEIAALNSPNRYAYDSYPGSDLGEVERRISNFKINGVRVGLVATLFGTIVWAYGDFVSFGPMC